MIKKRILIGIISILSFGAAVVGCDKPSEKLSTQKQNLKITACEICAGCAATCFTVCTVDPLACELCIEGLDDECAAACEDCFGSGEQQDATFLDQLNKNKDKDKDKDKKISLDKFKKMKPSILQKLKNKSKNDLLYWAGSTCPFFRTSVMC
ncbi:hypothetical protein [Leptospira santarosai]|uniref:hypothetical protein n=1 Tax=Leptospira santarosai TaxID=28183 RepID=UPI00037E5ECC|nr:hypothetical protein [Leptospira santarosai]